MKNVFKTNIKIYISITIIIGPLLLVGFYNFLQDVNSDLDKEYSPIIYGYEHDIIFTTDEKVHLTWKVSDKGSDHGTYVLYRNNLEVADGSWNVNENITYLALSLWSEGAYTMRLDVTDNDFPLHRSTENITKVKIINPNKQTPSYGIVFVIFGLVTIIAMKKLEVRKYL